MSIFVNELLCFLFNKYGQCPVKNIKSVLVDFYEDNDVTIAKDVLHDNLCKLMDDEDLPRPKSKRGDTKRRLEVDDIITLVTKADEAGVISQLPTFVCADLTKVPLMKPEDMDLCILAKKIAWLEATVAKHDTAIVEVRSDFNVVRSHNSVVSVTDGVLPQSDFPPLEVPPVAAASSWADIATQGDPSYFKEKEVCNHSRTLQSATRSRPVRLCGTKKAGNTQVKAVPRQLVAFVGRLNVDTTAQDLTSFLNESGLHSVTCRKLEAPGGKVFTTAAFRVSCPAEGNDCLLYTSPSPRD